jgi:hypothetical protein
MIYLLTACRPEPAPEGQPATPAPTASEPVWADPFAPQPDVDEGLTNVSDDLGALLEHGELQGACDRWLADPTDRRQELLCGKSMFFYEGFGTLGIPAVIMDMLPELFEPEVGAAWSRLGLVPHPTDPDGRPIGFGWGAPLGDSETLALTCASCHFGPLGDGRFAVGAPNHGYDYGRHMLAVLLVPQAAAPGFQEADHHPDALAAVRPMLDRLEAEPALRIQMGLELLSLLDAQGTAPQPTQEQEGQYASWSPGTMDFLIAPVPADDQVHTVSKITALWGLPTPEEEQAAGMPHAMLGWTGGTESLADFLGGFVTLGDGDEAGWTDERLRPLEQYILSLRAPAPLSPPPAEEIEAGEVVFREAGCTDCHGAPRGSGDRIFTFEEIGTDAAMAAWADPDMDGTLCCGMGESQDVATHGLKSPRLTGSSFFSRFLHNGSLVSLEQLLCLAERPPEAPEPHSPAGHTMGCDLPEEDRRALVAYLEAH